MSITIGVDIGGSHVSSAAINGNNFEIIQATYFSGAVDSKGTKEAIIHKWAEIINQSIQAVSEILFLSAKETIGIAFSMPGPFQYENGIAMFEGNDKYEALYNVSIAEELLKYLNTENVSFRFLNDASCFGVGSTLKQNPEIANKKVIAITLGTGFGAAFLHNKLPLTNGSEIPVNGCLWDKPFKDSIADNFFSTRWFLRQYENATGEKLTDGVKEIVSLENNFTTKLFHDFANNLIEFLYPFIVKFDADLLVIGGNIAKSHQLFLEKLEQNLKNRNVDVKIALVDNTEKTSIVGASYLYNEVFWERIKDELPFF